MLRDGNGCDWAWPRGRRSRIAAAPSAASRRAGRQNREGRGVMPRPDAIMLAPGHYAKRSGACKKRAVLDNLSMDRVLGMMVDIAASTGALNRPLGVEFFESAGAYAKYKRPWRAKIGARPIR